jgi:ectoine hydroxylase-related dioxygenase (phytanoyl-CoA dioxygenase family)
MTKPEQNLNELHQSYSSEGYVIAKHIFDSGSLSELCQSFKSFLNKLGTDDSPLECSINDAIMKREAQDHSIVYRSSQAVGSGAATYALLGGSGIFDMISDLTGFQKSQLHLMPMYLIVQIPSDERFDYTWHQDGSYYPWSPDFLTLWFPVNRRTGGNEGTISLIPGSHRYGVRETETFLKHGFFKQIQSKLRDEEESRETVLELDLGDCCIMNGNTIHRSVANRSATPRVAAVVRIVNLATIQSYDRDKFYCSHK